MTIKKQSFHRKGTQSTSFFTFLRAPSRYMLFMLCVISTADAAHADSVDSLRAFVRETQTARAQFSQTVLDRKSNEIYRDARTP